MSVQSDNGLDDTLYIADGLYEWLLFCYPTQDDTNETAEALDNDFKGLAAFLISNKTHVLASELHAKASQLLLICVEAIQWRYKQYDVNNLRDFVNKILTDPKKDAEKFLRFVQYLWWRALKGEPVEFPFKQN